MPDGLLLTILAALPFLGMFAAPFISPRHARNAAALLAGLVALAGLAIVIALFRHRESLNPDAFRALKW